jgi:excisionase family DNA binding protein
MSATPNSPGSAVRRNAEGERLLTTEQVADRWQVSKYHVYKLAREGKVPAVAVGRYYRFRLAALVEWEQAGGVPRGVGRRQGAARSASRRPGRA